MDFVNSWSYRPYVQPVCEEKALLPYICRISHTESSFTVGSVVNYLHPDDTAFEFSGRFLDSPSIVRLPSGKLISSMGVHE